MHINLTVGGALADFLPAEHTGNRARIAMSDNATVAELLEHLGIQTTRRLLIICNGNVVPPSDRTTTVLHNDDQLSLMPPITAG